MNKSFFIFICGFLMCTATMTAQAQEQKDFSQYYREFQVRSQDGKYGLLFRNEVVAPYKYDAIVAQQDNQGFISKQGGKYGIIGIGVYYGENISQQSWSFLVKNGVGEKEMNIYLVASVVPCEFDKIDNIDGRFWVHKGNQTGIYNMSGSNVLSCDNYDYIKVVDGRYNVGKGGLHGIYNMSGSNVLRCEFDEIKTINGRYWVSKDKKKGVYNFSGSTILNCEFDKIELTSDGKYITYKKGEKSLYSPSGSRLQTDFNVVYSTD